MVREEEENKIKVLEILYNWNNIMKSNNNNIDQVWFDGIEEGFADWAIWPFIRQFRNVEPEFFDSNKDLSFIKIWLDGYTNHPLYKILMEKYDFWDPTKEVTYFPSRNY